MEKAIEIVFKIFDGILHFMFSSYVAQGVSLGMIVIVCMLFALMISTLLNVPSGINSVLDRRIQRDIRSNGNKEGK